MPCMRLYNFYLFAHSMVIVIEDEKCVCQVFRHDEEGINHWRFVFTFTEIKYLDVS